MSTFSINYAINVRVKGSHAEDGERARPSLKHECTFADHSLNRWRIPKTHAFLSSDLCSEGGTLYFVVGDTLRSTTPFMRWASPHPITAASSVLRRDPRSSCFLLLTRIPQF